MHRARLASLALFFLGWFALLPLAPQRLAAQEVAPAVAGGKPTVKLLKCQAYLLFNCFVSRDGRQAVICEGPHDGDKRLALWDLEQGRLVRFLSAEKGKGTKEYDGDDTADFGARIEQSGSQAFTFSTDGKLAAINVNEIVRIWELASGRLLHEVEVGRFHPHTFRFADERQIVGKINGGVVIQAIDAPTGEQRKLMGPVGYESYGGAVRVGTFTLVSVGEVFSLSLKTGERTRLADVSPTSQMAPSRTWYSQDGGKLFIQRSELVQVLDMAKREYTALFQVTAPQKGHDIQALAEEAGLLVISQPKQVELWDAELGAVRTTVIPPSRLGRIGGISADGSKLILAQDEPGAVLLDFGGPPPAGEINVPKLIAEQAPAPGR
jgi:hypothetical protein